MSDSSWNIDPGPLGGLYRDSDSAWICGVCAGLADRFDFRLSTVRIIAVISLVLFFWLTAAVYLGATLLLKEKPLIYSGSRTEYEFWRRRDRNDWSHS
jgi:phage shock protein PspC (stress-responsive transcriptional regulator)